MMYCDKCNAEFPDGMNYCKWCGGTLRPKAAATTQLRKCFACGSPIQSGWEFCNTCGARQSPATQEPVNISPLCMRCGAIVPPGVSNCLRCGERFTAEHRSQPPANAPAPVTNIVRCSSCGETLDKAAVYCKACGAPVRDTGAYRSPSTPQPVVPPGQPPQTGQEPNQGTVDLGSFRQQPPTPSSQDYKPPSPPPNYQQTDATVSAREQRPPETSTPPFRSGRATDESGVKGGESAEESRKSTLETRVERPIPRDVLTPGKPGSEAIPPPERPTLHIPIENSFDNRQPPTMEIPRPPEEAENSTLDVSTIQIGVGDWMPKSFAKEQAKEPPDTQSNRPAGQPTIQGEPQNTVMGRGNQGQTAEWQQAPTIETQSYQSPQTAAPFPPPQTQVTGTETANPFRRTDFDRSQPPQPVPSPFPPPGIPQPSTQRKGGFPILAVAAAVVGLGLVAFLVYWFALKGKPTNTNANISRRTNENVSVANANTAVANTNTSTTSPKPVTPEGMVPVAAGKYTIGSDNDDDIEKPKHEVTLKAFYIDKTEVTNDEYKKFVDATNHKLPADWKGGTYEAGKQNFPVVNVTWQDAMDYAAWAGKRLPTEEEWEAAARGLDGRKYPWGNNWNKSYANIRGSGITEVGKFPNGKSPTGALDMIGNVWEWTASTPDLYPGNTGKPPEEASQNYRVIRGGAFDGDQRNDASYRGYAEANQALSKTGFRCVKDAAQ